MLGNLCVTDDVRVNGNIIADKAVSNSVIRIVQNISSLPTTINNAEITEDMVVLKASLFNPSAQSSDIIVVTSNGSLTISGGLSTSTTITLFLARSKLLT